MCLIVFAWRPGHALPLLLAANRDEFHARPSLPLAAWEDAPSIIGGRDLQAGGTWLGVRPDGRFAALTNIRIGGQPAGRRSRGELVERYLRGELAPADYLAGLSAGIEDYAGFNLLVGTARELWHFNSQSAAPRRLEAGVYGLCNADLDTPWPNGPAFTRLSVLLYTLILFGVTLLPFATRMSGVLYLGVALALGAEFIRRAWQLYRGYSDARARRTFRFSITYLFGLFAALLADHYLRW